MSLPKERLSNADRNIKWGKERGKNIPDVQAYKANMKNPPQIAENKMVYLKLGRKMALSSVEHAV